MTQSTLPLVAIVGRPNVGKSTLFNRLTRTRQAIVGDEPGITRDRNYGRSEWLGRNFELVDTGGLLPGDEDEIAKHIYEQAETALAQAAQVILLVDGRSEITSTDRELARRLLRAGKPLSLAVNKADTPTVADDMQDWHTLGIKNVFFISSEGGVGIDDLLDHVTSGFETGEAQSEIRTDEIRVAIIGKPNVGKSTLLNTFAGEQRAIVSPTPGTTRDAVDLLVERDGARFRFVDTAGIRRRGKTRLMAEKLSVVMAQRHIRLCHVALIMIDALDGVTALDSHIAGFAHQAGKGVVIVFNKWDMVEKQRVRSQELHEQIKMDLKFLDYAPVVFLSAQSGLNVHHLVKSIIRVGEACRTRIPTAELNKFFETMDFERASQPWSTKAKILYITQGGIYPPTFILFTNRRSKLHFSFERFIENEIRRRFGFEGSPIVLKTKTRAPRKK
jgi:GTP-binding protein